MCYTCKGLSKCDAHTEVCMCMVGFMILSYTPYGVRTIITTMMIASASFVRLPVRPGTAARRADLDYDTKMRHLKAKGTHRFF